MQCFTQMYFPKTRVTVICLDEVLFPKFKILHANEVNKEAAWKSLNNAITLNCDHLFSYFSDKFISYMCHRFCSDKAVFPDNVSVF